MEMIRLTFHHYQCFFGIVLTLFSKSGHNCEIHKGLSQLLLNRLIVVIKSQLDNMRFVGLFSVHYIVL